MLLRGTSGMTRAFVTVCLAAMVVPLAVRTASAQQLTARQPVFPIGITVVSSGSATATRVLNVYDVTPKNPNDLHQAPEFVDALARIGIGSNALRVAPLEVTIDAPPSKDRELRAAVAKAGWTIGTVARKPADPDSVARAALADATRKARLKAEAIAEADGRHVGKLLNVQPGVADIYSGITDKLAAMNPFASASSSGATVTESAIFTFALEP